MLQVCADFRDEVDELHGLLTSLKAEDWERETGFMQWTPWDVVAHLHYFDLVSSTALEGEEAFAPERLALVKALQDGRTNQQLARERFGNADAPNNTARYPAIVLIDESASMDCARVIRGINSMENAVICRLARRVANSGRSSGFRKPTRLAPSRRSSTSWLPSVRSHGGCTFSTISEEPSTFLASDSTRAPASA